MRNPGFWLCGAVLAGLVLALPAGAQAADLEELRPRWTVGDRWTVETVMRPLHVRGDVNAALAPAVRWEFVVAGREKVAGFECYRVAVTCSGAGRRPTTVLWIDANSMALRRITTEMPVAGGFREMTVRYATASGQATPVLGPLTALPIDTPVFMTGAKGLQKFTYQTHFGPPGRKAIGDVGFAHEIEQRTAAVSAEEVRKLLGDSRAKSLGGGSMAKSIAERPVTEVRLKSFGREVRQLWQSQRPWPVYCNNGVTVARLVETEEEQR